MRHGGQQGCTRSPSASAARATGELASTRALTKARRSAQARGEDLHESRTDPPPHFYCQTSRFKVSVINRCASGQPVENDELQGHQCVKPALRAAAEAPGRILLLLQCGFDSLKAVLEAADLKLFLHDTQFSECLCLMMCSTMIFRFSGGSSSS